MPLGETNVRRITGAGLVMATLATRLPLATKMLYEFDSIDFAVATFRFSLEQMTPHFPGYILHILFAKFLLLFVGDINRTFVWIGILLSIGSVLYLWRAAAVLRGERVGLIAAVIWLFLPIFWFHGIVATVYEYEAFFACAFLYHGLKLLRSPNTKWHFFALCIMLSLATGARQSSFIFFAPAIVFAAIVTRQSLKNLGVGFVLFIAVSALWISILFSFCGGASVYLTAMRSEHIYQSQSVLFGNGLTEHVAVMAKVILYLIGGGMPLLIIVFVALLLYPKRFLTFIKEVRSATTLQYVSLIALPPLVFYLAIYFMKAGYLLNVLPLLALAAAVTIDQVAIWRAQKIKTASTDTLLLTRPIITIGTILWTSAILVIEIGWFFLPSLMSNEEAYNDAFTRDSFGGLQTTVSKSAGSIGEAVNHILSFTSYAATIDNDALHNRVYDTLLSELGRHPNLILLDTWWHRWGYYYLPEATIYDIRDYDRDGILKVGVANKFVRRNIYEPLIEIPAGTEVLLLLRRDHPAFEQFSRQLTLERLDMPDHLDIWRVKNREFSLQWLDKRFIQQ